MKLKIVSHWRNTVIINTRIPLVHFIIIIFGGGGCRVVGGGRLFEVGRLLTFSTFRVGAYSRLGASSNKYGTCER